MRRLRQPVRNAQSLLRLAIRQVSAVPVLTGSILFGLAPAGHALTLGDIHVRSALGQRLNATVPVRLGAGESLDGSCISPGRLATELRGVPGATVTSPQAAREGAYELRVTTDAPLYEPMYELALEVQCPGVPILVRQYVLMLDLPGAVAASAQQAPSPAVEPVATVRAPVGVDQPAPTRPVRARTASRPVANIEAGSRYRVAEGDSLSAIAARVRGRDGSLQAMADAIQAANPEAFIRNDANLIKLGSEIVIPATARSPDTSLAATVAPAPTLPEIADPVPGVTASPPPAPTVTAAPPPDMAPAAILEPEPAVATPAKPVAVQKPVSADAPDEANPVVAAVAGIVFGLFVSALLWFRGRLSVRKRAAPVVTPRMADQSMAAAAALATAPVPLVTRESQPGFSVSYTPADEDALAAEFATDPEPSYAPPPVARSVPAPAPLPSGDITSELEELFDSTDTTIQKRLDADNTIAASAFDADADVDFLVGDPTGEEHTLRSSTVDQPRPNLEPTAQSPTVDLRSLASSATKDTQQAQTLLEALTLLERDYEEELTASQVLDMSAVRDALGDGPDDEPTQISDSRLREISARKTSR